MSDTSMLTQFITIYNNSPDGFMIVKNDIIKYTNHAICDILSCDVMERRACDVFGNVQFDTLKKALTSDYVCNYKDMIIGRAHVLVFAKTVEDGYIVLVRKTTDKLAEERCVMFSGELLSTISVMLRDSLNTTLNAVDMLCRKLPDDIVEDAAKYIGMMRKQCCVAAAQAEMICEEATRTFNKDRMCVSLIDISDIISRVANSARVQIEDSIDIEYENAGEKIMTLCNSDVIELVLYNTIAAIIRKGGCTKIGIKALCTDERATISIKSNGNKWGANFTQYVNRQRREHIADDIRTEGYEILRAATGINRHNGRLFIEETVDGGNSVVIVLPCEYDLDKKLDEFMSTRYLMNVRPSALIELSGVLPCEAYEPMATD